MDHQQQHLHDIEVRLLTKPSYSNVYLGEKQPGVVFKKHKQKVGKSIY